MSHYTRPYFYTDGLDFDVPNPGTTPATREQFGKCRAQDEKVRVWHGAHERNLRRGIYGKTLR